MELHALSSYTPYYYHNYSWDHYIRLTIRVEGKGGASQYAENAHKLNLQSKPNFTISRIMISGP